MMTPKSTEHAKFYSFKRQSSFGIRKFTIGVVSVSLGTALVATAPAASADTLEPASSALAAPSAELVSQVTADKTALAQALSAVQAIDLSQQAPEVAEGFVELFARATALLDQVDAEQAELDALAQELQQATLALTTELPTAVGTPVEVADADDVLPEVSETEVTEETVVAPEREAEVSELSIRYAVIAQEMIDASHLPDSLTRRNNLLTSVNVLPNLADIFGPLHAEGTTFEWRPNEHFEGVAGIADYGVQPENFDTPHLRDQYNKIISYTITLPNGKVHKRRFANVQVTDTNALKVNVNAEPDAKKMLTESRALLKDPFIQNGIVPTDNNTSYEWTVKPDTTTVGNKTGVITVRVTEGNRTLSSEYWVTVTVVDAPKTNQDSHSQLVEQVLRQTMAEGKLPIALRADSDPSPTNLLTTEDPILWQPNASKTVFNIDAKVGTEINETWTVAYDIPVPHSPFADATLTGANTYDIGDLKGSDLGALAGTTDGSRPYGRMVSNTTLLANELDQYAKTRLLQADEVYLSGLNKTLADYGLRVEADPVVLLAVGLHRRAGIDNGFNDHYFDVLPGQQTYRLKGTLRLPEGTVGNVAQTTWKDSFYIPLFGDVPREKDIDPTHWNGLPGARDAAETDYSKLSYHLTYTNGIYEPGRTTRNILWGSAEFPLLTSVRVYDDSGQTQAEVYKPTAVTSGVTLGANDRPDPAQLVANHSDLPSDTKYEFTEPVTALVAGTSKLVGVKITFADGSVATVYTLLKVRAIMAQQYMPEAQSLRLSRGASLRPVDFIKNASSLPADTRYSWAQEPSTQVVGSKVARVTVTYSDGSTDTITVRFAVR